MNADGSGSTDTDATPIASYAFDFGDGTNVVTTSATAQHTYSAPGTYTVTLIATDTAGKVSAPATESVTVSAPTGASIAVHVGYYGTHHPGNPQPKPSPWMGSPGVVFVGTPDSPSGGWDSSALRIDNLTGARITGVNVTVDIGSHHFALWGTNSIPAGQSLILAQTGYENFDGSDTSPAGCYSCNPKDCLTKVVSTVPVAHITIGATTTHYYDTGQIMNTHGADGAGCPYTGTRNDESHAWQQIYTQQPAAAQAAQAAQAAALDSVRVESAQAVSLRLGPAYPNPARESITLRFVMPASGPMQLDLYDVMGRAVKRSLEGTLDAGEYMHTVDLRGLPAGVYYCALWTPQRTLKLRFVRTD